MKTYSKLTAIAVCSFLFFSTSCQNNGDGGQSDTNDSTAAMPAEAEHVAITAVDTSPQFKDAQLAIASVKAEKAGADSAKVTFNFNVKNYELKQQTSDAGNKLCSNSDKGQHIHFILDNMPYQALYEPTNTITVANNSDHILMAFLSRSYHESLKTKGAALVYHFSIDGKGNLKKLAVPSTPMVFYSRPKGDYIGKDTSNVLFDFYVWNTTLSPDGYKVRAQIHNESGRDTAIVMTEWKSSFLHNLGMGKSFIILTLLDKDNKPVEGPNTQAMRHFNLAAQEPMQ